MGRLNGFDRIAPVYDMLAAIAFAGSIKRSQLSLLSYLPTSGQVLILGGGTGWIAEHVLRNSDVEIVYVDASARMISMARAKLAVWADRVQFIHGTEEHLQLTSRVDAVVANFYFDLFDNDRLRDVLAIISTSLHADGRLLVTDFVNDRGWKKLFLRFMYAFFRLVSGLNARSLPRWYSIITESHFEALQQANFFGSFITSVVFRKSA
jgi:tRNA (cmo5U34)-methyltransferase